MKNLLIRFESLNKLLTTVGSLHFKYLIYHYLPKIYLQGERINLIGPGDCLRFVCGRQTGVDRPDPPTLFCYLCMEPEKGEVLVQMYRGARPFQPRDWLNKKTGPFVKKGEVLVEMYNLDTGSTRRPDHL